MLKSRMSFQRPLVARQAWTFDSTSCHIHLFTVSVYIFEISSGNVQMSSISTTAVFSSYQTCICTPRALRFVASTPCDPSWQNLPPISCARS